MSKHLFALRPLRWSINFRSQNTPGHWVSFGEVWLIEKLLFIFNPATGAGRLRGKLMQILCLFSAGGYDLHVFPTEGPGDAARVVKDHAAGHSLVVCCGGDGTLNEVVEGLSTLEAPPELGYIPGGTTNDFASSLHLPKTDMLAAAGRILAPHKLFLCDIGQFNKRIFTYVAAFGAFTDVPYETRQDQKNVFGYFAYILEALPRLPSLHPWRVEIETDDMRMEDDFLFGMVSNSTSVGGFSFPGKERVRMDDGLFEMALVHNPQNLADLGELSASLLTRNLASPLITTLRAKKIRVKSERRMPWTLDGEFGGRLHDVDIRVRPRALKIRI